MPKERWQPRIGTALEGEAIEAIKLRLSLFYDADALRQGLRVADHLRQLIVHDGCELYIADANGLRLVSDCFASTIPALLLKPDKGQAYNTGDGDKHQRRWTVNASKVDCERTAAMRLWYADGDKPPSSRATWRAVLLSVGEICRHLDAGHSLWAKDSEDEYRLVVL